MIKKWNFEKNGQQIPAVSAWVQDSLWVHLNGKTWVLESPQSQMGSQRKIQKAGGSGSSFPHLVKAPMPGRVTKVMVQIGDRVEKGQPVLMMEAMKMEYTLKSELETSVEDVKVQLGDQVSLGQVLVQLKVEKNRT